MGVEVTSAIAYREIEALGITAELQAVVYECIEKYGPLTAGEMYEILGRGRYSYHKRLSELEKLGYIKSVSRRKCSTNGKLAKVWEVDTDE